MREYSWAPYGSRIHSHSVSQSGPATLTLLPIFTRLEALPFEVVQKAEMIETLRTEER